MALTKKQIDFIPAFLSCKTVEQACKQADVSKSSYYEWLKDDEFREELQKQQAEIYNVALFDLKNLMPRAVAVYNKLLDNTSPTIRLKAAQAVFFNAAKVAELFDIQEQIRVLTDQIEGISNADKG
jgi:phage terminase small subunit